MARGLPVHCIRPPPNPSWKFLSKVVVRSENFTLRQELGLRTESAARFSIADRSTAGYQFASSGFTTKPLSNLG